MAIGDRVSAAVVVRSQSGPAEKVEGYDDPNGDSALTMALRDQDRQADDVESKQRSREAWARYASDFLPPGWSFDAPEWLLIRNRGGAYVTASNDSHEWPAQIAALEAREAELKRSDQQEISTPLLCETVVNYQQEKLAEVFPPLSHDARIDQLTRERDEATAFASLAAEQIGAQFREIAALREVIAAKDARIADLDSELAKRPTAFVDPEPEPLPHNPFRTYGTDHRRVGR
jgi:hypothetical protein